MADYFKKCLERSGLEYEELEKGDLCWIITDSGVVRGFVKDVVNDDPIRYDVITYLSERDQKVVFDSLPQGSVFSLKMDGKNTMEARREKQMRLTNYYQTIFINR